MTRRYKETALLRCITSEIIIILENGMADAKVGTLFSTISAAL